jgi:fluoride exporter
MKNVIYVGLGGFLGSSARYLIQKFFAENTQNLFPFSTLIINIIGCFLIGLIIGYSDKTNIFTNEMRLFLTVGICGGFTTFSTFSNDSLQLLRSGNLVYFFLYIIASVTICLLFTYLGYLIFKN